MLYPWNPRPFNIRFGVCHTDLHTVCMYSTHLYYIVMYMCTLHYSYIRYIRVLIQIVKTGLRIKCLYEEFLAKVFTFGAPTPDMCWEGGARILEVQIRKVLQVQVLLCLHFKGQTYSWAIQLCPLFVIDSCPLFPGSKYM